MNALVSTFTNSAVPGETSWSSARGATSPQMSPASRPSRALPASATANQAVTARAPGCLGPGPGALAWAGVIPIRVIPPRFPEDRIGAAARDGRRTSSAALPSGRGPRSLDRNLRGSRGVGHAVVLEVTMAVTIIVIVIVVVLLAAAAGILLRRQRALQQRFGPEYDRLAAEVGPRRALSELAERERRIAQLDIRPLSAERRAAYDTQWATLQEEFIDTPPRAAEAADSLVTAVAADRGYQVADRERLFSDLSVYHADRIQEYRLARQTTEQAGTAATEDLRQAMLAYRTLLRELLEAPDGASEARPATEATPPVSPTPPLTPPVPPAPRTSGLDDADETETRSLADGPNGLDGPESPERPLDDRSAA